MRFRVVEGSGAALGIFGPADFEWHLPLSDRGLAECLAHNLEDAYNRGVAAGRVEVRRALATLRDCESRLDTLGG